MSLNDIRFPQNRSSLFTKFPLSPLKPLKLTQKVVIIRKKEDLHSSRIIKNTHNTSSILSPTHSKNTSFNTYSRKPSTNHSLSPLFKFSPTTKLLYGLTPNKSLANIIYEQGNNAKVIANEHYKFYTPAKHAGSSCYPIISYGANTYQGLVRKFNEDRISISLNVKCPLELNDKWTNETLVSFFGLYDGHNGDKCSDYLKTHLHHFIFQDPFFPSDPKKAIIGGFANAEKTFMNFNYTKKTIRNNSGSCALVVLIVNDMCYIANIGDSRAIYSHNSGQECYQLSRDHKPTDLIEKTRIIKEGGAIYRAKVLGKQNLPWRILPGKLSVSRSFGDIEAKVPFFNGNPKILISTPSVTSFAINGLSDFIVLGSDGIYDKLSNEEIVSLVWNSSMRYNRNMKIHEYCGVITDIIMKQSLKKCTVDNISCIFICFENFAKKSKEILFKYQCNKRLMTIKMKDDETEICSQRERRNEDIGNSSDVEVNKIKEECLPPIVPVVPNASNEISKAPIVPIASSDTPIVPIEISKASDKNEDVNAMASDKKVDENANANVDVITNCYMDVNANSNVNVNEVINNEEAKQ